MNNLKYCSHMATNTGTTAATLYNRAMYRVATYNTSVVLGCEQLSSVPLLFHGCYDLHIYLNNQVLYQVSFFRK